MVQLGTVRLHHIGTNEQVTNIFTEPLGKVKFLTFCERLGVLERPPPMRVPHELDIVLWELLGAWGTSWSYERP